MPLLGQGVAAIWHNVDPAFRDDYNNWHVHEHVPERVGTAGFLRGRRYVAIDGEPEFFHFYETHSLATLTSHPYLERLNSPTPWTRQVVPNIRDNNRSLCEVVESCGIGAGAVILTGRLATEDGQDETMATWLTGTLNPAMSARPGIVGLHLLRGDLRSSATLTEEKALRDRPDEVADWVLLVEAIEAAIIGRLRSDGVLTESALKAQGASRVALGLYALHYALSKEDLT